MPPSQHHGPTRRRRTRRRPRPHRTALGLSAPDMDRPPYPHEREEAGSAMIPGQFDYVRPGDIDQALMILREREREAKLLSGGYSLIPLIKLRLAQPTVLVDLRDVGGLDGITETDDELR